MQIRILWVCAGLNTVVDRRHRPDPDLGRGFGHGGITWLKIAGN
jgi:hypothetical protein